MTTPKFHPVTHMGHDGPWLLLKTAKEIRERRAFIRTNKPEHERALRLRLLKVVRAPLPPRLVKANVAWVKAKAALAPADAARDKAYDAWVTARAARVKAYDTRNHKAYVAWVKAKAALDNKDYDARVEAHVARNGAYAALVKASVAWDTVINSPAGVKFHAQVCGCAWTPSQPDILRQLEQTP